MPNDSTPLAREVSDALRRQRFTHASEGDLQAAIYAVLLCDGHEFQREAVLGAAGRIDFLTTKRLGIECKLRGSNADVAAQLQRYAASGMVGELLLVTTRAGHAAFIPRLLQGVPVFVHVLDSGIV